MFQTVPVTFNLLNTSRVNELLPRRIPVTWKRTANKFSICVNNTSQSQIFNDYILESYCVALIICTNGKKTCNKYHSVFFLFLIFGILSGTVTIVCLKPEIGSTIICCSFVWLAFLGVEDGAVRICSFRFRLRFPLVMLCVVTSFITRAHREATPYASAQPDLIAFIKTWVPGPSLSVVLPIILTKFIV